MKTLRFSYKMQLDFDDFIQKHRFTLKCIPVDNRRQQIIELHKEIFPNEFLEEDRDSFGNVCIYGYAEKPHNHFSVEVTGVAQTGLANYEMAVETHKLGMYKYATYYTQPGKNLCEYFSGFHFQENAGNYAKALCMMEKLYRDFQYVSGATGISTTAEDAWTLGRGVCQDYSHIMISLCQMAHIPARYVVGMLIGEGLSHAWVKILENGIWIGLDPTNNLIVDSQHIKISNGRDYHDCTINQGMFVGNAKQTQEVAVSVEEITTDNSLGYEQLSGQ